MKKTVKPLAQRPAWKALTAHHKKIKDVHVCANCSPRMPKRGEKLTASAAGLFLDYSKNRVTGGNPRALFLRLAKESGFERTHRRDVLGREDQYHRKPCRFACRPCARRRAMITR